MLKEKVRMKKLLIGLLSYMAISNATNIVLMDSNSDGTVKIYCINNVEYIQTNGSTNNGQPGSSIIVAVDKNGKPLQCVIK